MMSYQFDICPLIEWYIYLMVTTRNINSQQATLLWIHEINYGSTNKGPATIWTGVVLKIVTINCDFHQISNKICSLKGRSSKMVPLEDPDNNRHPGRHPSLCMSYDVTKLGLEGGGGSVKNWITERVVGLGAKQSCGRRCTWVWIASPPSVLQCVTTLSIPVSTGRLLGHFTPP